MEEIHILYRRLDLSFGIYLYSWPVQQMLIHWFGASMSAIKLFVVSLTITAPIALISWLKVEQPTLNSVRNLALRFGSHSGATR